MTTADRFRPAHRAWVGAAPSTVTAKDEHYVGTHRSTVRRSFTLLRMFYTAKHRRRRH